MKVKNIMFAGFAAAILSGACGAARAEGEAGSTVKILASKAFVEAQVDELDKAKQDVITDLDTIRTQAGAALPAATAETTYATKALVGTIPEGANAKDVVGYVDEKTAGIATDLQFEGLTNRVGAVEDKVNSETDGLATKASQAALDALSEKVGTNSVATQIANELTKYETKANLEANYATKAELDNKQDTLTFDDTPTVDSANPVKSSGVYSALAGKADAADIPTDYVSETAFNTYKGDMTTALAGKAATGDVSALGTRVETLENAGYQNAGQVESAIDAATSDMLTKAEATTTYATTSALNDVKATADAAQTAEEVASAIDTKVADLDKEDTAVANQFVTAVSEADGVIAVSRAALTADNIPELPQAKVTNLATDLDGKLDKATENGNYLVTKDATGVRYTAVQVVAGDGTTDLLTGAALVQ